MTDQGVRRALPVAMFAAYMVYAAVRILGLGDAAAYNSIAFFLYEARPVLRCTVRNPAEIAAAWLARLRQLLHLSLAHLHP